jgi:TonB family protein
MPVSAGSELDRVAQTGAGLQSLNQSDRADTGTTLDATVDPIWGAYLAGLNQLIDQHWQRVAVASTRRTQIRFRVDRQGRVTGLQIMQTSGDPVADQAALEAVRAAAPFAPLPQNAPEEVLTVNFTFTRWLNPASP